MRQRWESTMQDTVASDGTATATITPGTRPPTTWVIVDTVTVNTSTGRTDVARAALYRGSPDPIQFLAASDRGGGDSASGSCLLSPGVPLVAAWSGGTPGDIATLRVEGWQTDDPAAAGGGLTFGTPGSSSQVLPTVLLSTSQSITSSVTVPSPTSLVDVSSYPSTIIRISESVTSSGDPDKTRRATVTWWDTTGTVALATDDFTWSTYGTPSTATFTSQTRGAKVSIAIGAGGYAGMSVGNPTTITTVIAGSPVTTPTASYALGTDYNPVMPSSSQWVVTSNQVLGVGSLGTATTASGRPGRMHSGNAMFSYSTHNAGVSSDDVTFAIVDVETGAAIFQVTTTVAAGATGSGSAIVVMPRAPILVTVKNGSALNITWNFSLITS